MKAIADFKESHLSKGNRNVVREGSKHIIPCCFYEVWDQAHFALVMRSCIDFFLSMSVWYLLHMEVIMQRASWCLSVKIDTTHSIWHILFLYLKYRPVCMNTCSNVLTGYILLWCLQTPLWQAAQYLIYFMSNTYWSLPQSVNPGPYICETGTLPWAFL